MFTAKLELPVTKNYIEWSSIECRKPNELTLVITKHRDSTVNQSTLKIKYTKLTQSTGK